MYVETVPNRGARATVLLRESFREGGKVRKRTLANLTSWKPAKIAGLRAALRGKAAGAPIAFDILCSTPHGHVAAVLGMLRVLGLDQVLRVRPSRERQIVSALIAARILFPGSKLATARGLTAEAPDSSLPEMLDLGDVSEDEIYAAMDWLLTRQSAIEKKLAERHLEDGSIVLYDLSSSYFEGRKCPLAKIGYSRDGKRGTLQIVYGLLTDKDGRPVAVEVFEGNTGDPSTLSSQVEKLMTRFSLARVVLVGDRGMITQARVEELRATDGVDWVTALRAPQIQRLHAAGMIQLSLFDEHDLMEVSSPDFPGERLVICRNPLLAEERTRKRHALMAGTHNELQKVQRMVERGRLRDPAKIGMRVGRKLDRFKMAKHFEVTIRKDHLSWTVNDATVERESALDGIYVLRTSVVEEQMPRDEVVRTYKSLSRVERAFRSLKTVDLKVRPIFHRRADRVRAHVFLCMLAYYVEWHMRERLAPLLFDDEEREAAEAKRDSVVAPAKRSDAALCKASSGRTADGAHAVQSFQGLLRKLGTIARNVVQPQVDDAPSFVKTTRPNSLQQRALDLLGVTL